MSGGNVSGRSTNRRARTDAGAPDASGTRLSHRRLLIMSRTSRPALTLLVLIAASGSDLAAQDAFAVAALPPLPDELVLKGDNIITVTLNGQPLRLEALRARYGAGFSPLREALKHRFYPFAQQQGFIRGIPLGFAFHHIRAVVRSRQPGQPVQHQIINADQLGGQCWRQATVAHRRRRAPAGGMCCISSTRCLPTRACCARRRPTSMPFSAAR